MDGKWTTVSLPWHEFLPVKRAQVRVARPQNGAPLGNDLGMSVQEPANVWTPGLECRCYQAHASLSLRGVKPATLTGKTKQKNYTLSCAVQVDRSKPAVDPTEVRQFGLVLSRFEFNGYTNPNYRCRRR